jgi:ATP/maltotriose-dependent transcriptional regulator MalT
MPNQSERNKTLSDLKTTLSDLKIQMSVQVMLDASEALLKEEEGDDGDSDVEFEDEQVVESFQLVGYAIIGALEVMQQKIAGSRFMAERKVWRGLREIRGAQMEFMMGMDENWFKQTVCQNDANSAAVN